MKILSVFMIVGLLAAAGCMKSEEKTETAAPAATTEAAAPAAATEQAAPPAATTEQAPATQAPATEQH